MLPFLAPLLLKFPLLGRIPWRLVGAGVLALVLAVGYLKHRSSLIRIGEARAEAKCDAGKLAEAEARLAQYAADLAAYKADLAAQEAATADLTLTLAEQRAISERLQQALSRATLVTHVPPTTLGDCPTVRLSRSFRLCINAAVDGTAAATADCEATGMRIP